MALFVRLRTHTRIRSRHIGGAPSRVEGVIAGLHPTSHPRTIFARGQADRVAETGPYNPVGTSRYVVSTPHPSTRACSARTPNVSVA